MFDMINISEFISSLVIRSLLYEAAVSPKPGLVDRFNNGAHTDMNYFLFMDSASCLAFPFYEMAKTGFNYNGVNMKELFSRIRQIGIKAEKKMFAVTKGINTHKGLIFSLGLVSAASGYIIKNNYIYKNELIINYICKTISEMTSGIVEEELGFIKYSNKNNLDRAKLTYGEKNFLVHGTAGIRGEAENGFPNVVNIGLPALNEFKYKLKEDKNAVFLQVLLNLMINVEDSNVIGRHGMSVLKYMQACAKEALIRGGAFTKEGLDYIYDIDNEFIKRNISPGGCADLLSVTILLYLIKESFCDKRENSWCPGYVPGSREESNQTKKIDVAI